MPNRQPLVAALWSVCAVLQGGEFCSPADGHRRHDLELFAGYSPTTSTLIGTATDRKLAVVGASYGYRCWIWGQASLSYTATALPAAILRQPRESGLVGPDRARGQGPHWVYGFAAAPVGFTLELERNHRIYPFLETVEGVIASTEPIPEYGPNATGLNFLFDLGGGIRWNAGGRGSVVLGYRFLHISNANTTDFNPGLDNNVFYLGYAFALGAK